MRTHDRPTDPLDGQTSDITVADCDRHIEDLTERIVACRCTCPADILTLAGWKNRRLHLLQIPQQRSP